MIHAVLFDLGETLIDFGVGRAEAEGVFREGARNTFNYLRAKNTPVPPFQQYFKTHYRLMQRRYIWSKISRRDFSYLDVVREATAKLNLHLDDHTQRELAWHWYGPIREGSALEPNILHLLETLALSGLKLGIVSNTLVPGHCLDRHLAQTGLLAFFPVRIYSSDIRFRKPDSRIFDAAIEQLAIDPVRTVFVGDLLATDIRGAKRMGMKTVWKVAPPKRTVPPAHSKPDDIIFRLAQLPESLARFGWKPAAIPAEPIAAVA